MDNSDTNTLVTKSTILSFKPRQVILLAQHNPCPNKETKIITQPTLNQSLLDYFYRNGFGKTVKRFQSEALIQSDALKASPSPLRLEDIFCKYNACDADSNKSSSNKPVLGKDEAQKTDKESPTNEEKPTKKKKKKKKGTVESDNGVIEDRPEVTYKKNESSKSCAQISEDTKVDEQETKPKKKKKTKHNLDSSTDELEKPVDDTVNGLKIDDLTKNSKDKKKKSIEQDDLEASTTNEIELVTGVAEKEREKKKKKSSTESAEDEVNTVKTDIENEIKLVTEVAEKGRKKKKKKSSTESAEDEVNTVTTDIENEIKLVTKVAEKGRKKKKKKSSSESAVNEDEVNTVKTGTENEIELVTEVAEKERRKKKKKKPSTDSAVNEDEVNTVKTVTENETISKKEKKSYKKRKRSLSDDDENVKPITEMRVIEESKRQKTEISEENSKSEGNNAQETSKKLLDEQTNGKVKVNGGEKSGALKSKQKERNATAEPKSVNAFQRVKIEQVEFAHEKLQDNSYWAKDGAEIGYGAKAQEVLGQVRGRDFRHEKTKKKRGTYTGGLIDLQSHSVKFSYCDEE